MRYLILLFGFGLFSCSVLDETRIECIKEYYDNIPMNNETKILDDCLDELLDEYFNYESDEKYYFHDSLDAMPVKVGIDTSHRLNKDILGFYPEIQEALSDLAMMKQGNTAISFNSMDNFKKYNNLIPINCNENFKVRKGWEISITKIGMSNDSTVCCIIFNILQCGEGCWGDDLVILHKTNNKWKLIAKIILKTGS